MDIANAREAIKEVEVETAQPAITYIQSSLAISVLSLLEIFLP